MQLRRLRWRRIIRPPVADNPHLLGRDQAALRQDHDLGDERTDLFVRIDKIDAGMNPRVKEVAVENLERMVLYEDLSQMNE